MSENLAENYADRMGEEVAEVMAAVRDGGQIEGQDATEYLDEWPLEVVRQVGRRFEVVLTVGGPDARICCDLDSDGDRMGRAVLEVGWDHDARRYSSDIDALADYFATLYV